jgi:hypothetical protein
LDAALRSALDRLSRPEDYFKPETEHGANALGAVSGGSYLAKLSLKTAEYSHHNG